MEDVEESSYKTSLASGIITEKRSDIEDIMKHNYLRRSMEQRIQRKALLENFKKSKNERTYGSKETISSKLRSISIMNKLRKNTGIVRGMAKR